ncbi:MAG: tetratricopeptide repeat protein [Pirellulaceae bacterium]
MRFMFFRVQSIVGLCAIYILACNSVFGQKIGDRVVVMVTSDAKIADRIVEKVYSGEIHKLLDIQGSKREWCSLEGVGGWVPTRNIMNMEPALKQFSARIANTPNDWDALATRGLIHFEMNEFTKAFTDLNEALKYQSGVPTIWNNRGRVLKAQGKLALALGDFKKALELNPNYPHAHFNLGLVYYGMNDFDNAIKSYDEAIKLNDIDVWYYVNRGNTKHAKGDVAGALSDYDAAEKINLAFQKYMLDVATFF